MKKLFQFFIVLMFIAFASCGPRENSQDDQQYDQDTIPETQMQDQNGDQTYLNESEETAVIKTSEQSESFAAEDQSQIQEPVKREVAGQKSVEEIKQD